MEPEKELAFYIDADNASLMAQNRFLLFSKLNLLLTIGAAIITASSIFIITDYKTLFVYGTVLCLGLSIILTILLRYFKLEKVWYEGRAIAESVKTVVWRFVSKASPYNLNEGFDIAEFNKTLSDIYRKTVGVKLLNIYKPENVVIPNELLDLRLLSLNNRKETYKEHRIISQLNWYSKKAKFNKDNGRLWYNITLGSQVVAFLIIVYVVFVPQTSLALIGAFTSMAAASYAWLQLKQFNSVSQAYLVTANELEQILLKINDVNSEEAFSDFVIEAENAISREHTLWVAKRI